MVLVDFSICLRFRGSFLGCVLYVLRWSLCSPAGGCFLVLIVLFLVLQLFLLLMCGTVPNCCGSEILVLRRVSTLGEYMCFLWSYMWLKLVSISFGVILSSVCSCY